MPKKPALMDKGNETAIKALRGRVVRPGLVLAQVCTVLIVGSFFLPWIHVRLAKAKPSASAPAKARKAKPSSKSGSKLNYYLSETLSGVTKGGKQLGGRAVEVAGLPRRISGVRIPRLANSENAKSMMQLAELITKKRERLGAKSYLVYLLPGLALLFGGLLTRWPTKRWVAVPVAVLALAIALGGTWQLLTMDTRAPVIAIHFGIGLWLSLLGYTGIAAGATWLSRLPRPPVRPRSPMAP